MPLFFLVFAMVGGWFIGDNIALLLHLDRAAFWGGTGIMVVWTVFAVGSAIKHGK